MNVSNRQTIDIETAGNTVELALHGNDTVEIVIRGDGTASYAIDVRESDSGTWMQDAGPTYSGSADYSDTLSSGVPQLRVRCTSGTATAGNQADVLVSAGGS